jgi:copper chaperone CopZ
MSEQTLRVQGMTCGHCAHAVTEELSALDGVQQVTVALVPDGVSTVTLQTDAELPTDAIVGALAEAGDYTLAP